MPAPATRATVRGATDPVFTFWGIHKLWVYFQLNDGGYGSSTVVSVVVRRKNDNGSFCVQRKVFQFLSEALNWEATNSP